MLKEDVNTTQESLKPKRHVARGLGASLTAAAVLATPQIGRKPNSVAQPTAMPTATGSVLTRPDVKPNQHRGPSHPEGLRGVWQLPGINIEAADQDRELLKDATVKIIRRLKDFNGPFEPWCTGTVVSLPDPIQSGQSVRVVETAGHCADEATGGAGGMFAPGQYEEPAINFVDQSAYEFAIADPQDPNYSAHNLQPIAMVDGISVYTKGIDMAFLHVRPLGHSLKGGPGIRDFDQIPDMSYGNVKNHPVIGEQIAIYGLPASSESMPVAGTGTYLGPTTYTDSYWGEKHQVYVVGVNSKAPENDGCWFGASGSKAKGKNFYPASLTIRINLDDASVLLARMGIRPNDPDYASEINRMREIEQGWKDMYSKQLGIDLTPFDTLCMFGVPQPGIAKVLWNGFSIAPPGLEKP